jgi:two-component sensor histidine kinase
MRILIVDDDPDFRQLAMRQVQREFSDAAIVDVGDREGLRAAISERPAIGLLVSDFSLNWGDGFEVLETVRSRVPDCPAVMFTGTGNEDLAVRALKAGFGDYVVKSPKQLRRLAAACRAAVMRHEKRRGLQRHGDLLTEELYHRLHNNLQLVVSLIASTARAVSDTDARRKLQDLAQRVTALSLLQERLHRGGDFRAVDFASYLRQLGEELAALHGGRVGLEFATEQEGLPVTVAVPLGLVANELIVNALKHAFPEGRQGRILVRFGASPRGETVLEVADDGVGIVSEAASEGAGLGMSLVGRLVAQLRGRMNRHTGTAGTSFVVTVPPAEVDA